MTHTFAILKVSNAVYEEIKNKLVQAGYGHALIEEYLDMHGLALAKEDAVSLENEQPET